MFWGRGLGAEKLYFGSCEMRVLELSIRLTIFSAILFTIGAKANLKENWQQVKENRYIHCFIKGDAVEATKLQRRDVHDNLVLWCSIKFKPISL